MNQKFGGAATTTRAQLQRERMMYVGGGTFLMSLIALGALIFSGQGQVEARPDLKDNKEQLADVFGTVALVAPTAPVPQGTRLSQIALKELYWPRSEVPEGAIRDLDQAKEMYAKVSLAANQPILRSNLSSSPTIGGLSDLIPPGHRAVTIEVDATTGVEGWATPGAHVDVYLTYRDPEDSVDKTRVAVEDAVVLSFNGRTEKSTESSDTDSKRVAAASTVTLAVSAEDALKLQTAVAVGRVSLALRNGNDPRTAGPGIFAANEWEKKKKEAAKFVSKGFAQMRDEKGNLREFQLGPDARWWENQDSDS